MSGATRHFRYALWATVLFAVLLAAGMGVASWQLALHARTTTQLNTYSAALDAVESRMYAAESEQRAFLLTRDAAYLNGFRARSRETLGALSILATHPLAASADSLNARALEAAVQTQLAQMEKTVTRYVSEGARPGRNTLPKVRGFGSAPWLLAKFDLSKAAEAQRNLHAARTERAAQWLLWLNLLGIPAGLLWISGLLRYARRTARFTNVNERGASEAREALSQKIVGLENEAGRLAALSGYATALQASQTKDEAVEVTRQVLRRQFPGSEGAIYITSAADPERAVRAGHWGNQPTLEVPVIRAEQCSALRLGHSIFHDGASQDCCGHLSRIPTLRTSCCVLVSNAGTALGVFALMGESIAWRQHNDFLTTIAEQLGMALSNLDLRDQLKEQSIREPLSGLFNRRYMEESLVREVSRAHRRNQPLSILMFDVDHFKAYNDSQGHLGGDAALREIGAVLRKISRADDIACRYGGEEFLVILPETPMDGAHIIAERLRAAIAAHRIEMDGKTLPSVTVSIGIASTLDAGTDSAGLVRMADAALYRAKRKGRNRIEGGEAPASPSTAANAPDEA